MQDLVEDTAMQHLMGDADEELAFPEADRPEGSDGNDKPGSGN